MFKRSESDVRQRTTDQDVIDDRKNDTVATAARLGGRHEARPQAEIPDNLESNLRIVGIEQRKKLSREIILKGAVGGEANPGGIFLRSFPVRRRPFDAFSRHNVHSHALFDEHEIVGAYEIGDQRGVFRIFEIAGLTGRRQFELEGPPEGLRNPRSRGGVTVDSGRGLIMIPVPLCRMAEVARPPFRTARSITTQP